MKKIYLILLILSGINGVAQTLTVDDTSNSPAELVNIFLGTTCLNVSNISISSNQSVAYFNTNGSSFPINEGIIIRSGLASSTQGKYTDSNLSDLSSPASGGGSDPFLQNLSNSSSGTTNAITDLAYLTFDFIPISDLISFDFLFASNEYGYYQCLSNDIFAFELTDLTTGITTNLAVVPGTSKPVSVKNIKNSIYNNTCASTNPNLFGVYNVDNPGISALNMRGYTNVLNASSTVVPNRSYRLKMVVADYEVFGYDSAVFLAGESFKNSLDLGEDKSICLGDSYILNTNLDNTYTFKWYLNGTPISGETSPTYKVTAPGTYSVEVSKGDCFITDSIVFKNLGISTPISLQTCNNGSASYTWDLTVNNEAQLGVDNNIYKLFYYKSLADITANNPIPDANLKSFGTTNSQLIYIKIFNKVTGHFCNSAPQFNLTINSQITAPEKLSKDVCINADVEKFEKETLHGLVLNGMPEPLYTITYYKSLSEAQIRKNSLGAAIPFSTVPIKITFWALVQSIINPDCFAITEITLNILALPTVSKIENVLECENYTLPVITDGNYFAIESIGGKPEKVPYSIGDVINKNNIYYIESNPDANGCVNISSFDAFFVQDYNPSLDNCGEFVIPKPDHDVGAFYTAPGGPYGSAALIPVGTVFKNTTRSSITQDIYFYSEMDGSLCVDELFTINIHPLPLIDYLADVVTCDSYILPNLPNGGEYYLLPGGPDTLGQISFREGDVIQSSQIIYIYNKQEYTDVDGIIRYCPLENPVSIYVVNTSLFRTINDCGSHTLPTITFGGYFDAPGGMGNPIDPDTPITAPQTTVYYYAETTTSPNCTDNLHYDIIVKPQPPVDTVPSDTHCGEFILPQLTNGKYYLLSGGPSAIGQKSFNAGDIIDLSGTNLSPGEYWIYNYQNGNTCDNEISFTININPFPDINQYINTIECMPYTIPSPSSGAIYTAPGGPNGTGVKVNSSTVFNTTQSFYLFFEDLGCKIDKHFTKIYKGINLPDYDDIATCDSYTLSPLNHVPPDPEINYTINYHFDNPNGPIVPANYVFNNTNASTPRTIYVYAVNTDNHFTNCPESKYFTVTVSETPVLPEYVSGKEYCGSYTLPDLPVYPDVNYTVNYYSQPGGIGLITPANYIFSNPGTYTVYVYATAINNVNCSDGKQFKFTVYPLLNTNILDGVICVDPLTDQTLRPYTINTGLSSSGYKANWYLEGALLGKGLSFKATKEGIYDIKFTKLTPESGASCNFKDARVVVTKSSAAIAALTLSGAFENQINIVVNINGGYGDYEFKLDNGAYQLGNVFYDVASGEHTVTVTDTKGGCGDLLLTANVLRYPHFFTPNGDGYNDFWNINDLKSHPEAIINIYDRIGKLVKQISPTGQGWDGTYNGKPLPSTDYWFNVFYKLDDKEQEFKSHFSLKR